MLAATLGCRDDVLLETMSGCLGQLRGAVLEQAVQPVEVRAAPRDVALNLSDVARLPALPTFRVDVELRQLLGCMFGLQC